MMFFSLFIFAMSVNGMVDKRYNKAAYGGNGFRKVLNLQILNIRDFNHI